MLKRTLSYVGGRFVLTEKSKVLRRLKARKVMLNDFFVFDTETGRRTKDGIQWCLRARPDAFIFGVVYGHNFTKVIHNVEDMRQEFLLPRYKNKKVFAHNVIYDLGSVYGNIFELDAAAIFNGKFISCTNGNCTFADSMNIFQTSVAKLGKMVGIDKPALGNEYMFSAAVGADEINRCITDCVIVWEALYRIFEEVGNIKITHASLSLTFFRSHFQKFDIEHNENVKYFWESYYGGRTEAFKIGKTHAQVIDVNSMYPEAMRKCVFPNPKFLKRVENVSAAALKKIMFEGEGMAKMEVEHKKMWLGFLPVRKGGKLVFPVGCFSGSWNFHEIRFALENDVIEIKKIFFVCYGERMESPFVEYVDTLYGRRLRSKDDFEKFRLKIFMNSLYGKFAQRITEETVYIKDYEAQSHVIDSYKRQGRFLKMSCFNATRKDCILTVTPPAHMDTSFTIPSFASYITSYARVMLLKKLIEIKTLRPVYCDTDSIFYEVDGLEQSDTFIGGWKKENKVVTEIRGLKNYTFVDYDISQKEVKRIKGVPKNAVQVKENEYRYENLVKPKEALRRGILAGVLIERNKVIKNLYEKRVVSLEGETEPIIL